MQWKYENRKPHFRHQRNIFFIAMIKVDRLMAGIKFVIPQCKALFLTQLDGHAVCAVGIISTVVSPLPPSRYAPSDWLAANAPPHKILAEKQT